MIRRGDKLCRGCGCRMPNTTSSSRVELCRDCRPNAPEREPLLPVGPYNSNLGSRKPRLIDGVDINQL